MTAAEWAYLQWLGRAIEYLAWEHKMPTVAEAIRDASERVEVERARERVENGR